MPKLTIKATRVNTGLTQAQMADVLGVSLSLYQDIENGDREIKPMELYALCHVTGFAEDEIEIPRKSAKRERLEGT